MSARRDSNSVAMHGPLRFVQPADVSLFVSFVGSAEAVSALEAPAVVSDPDPIESDSAYEAVLDFPREAVAGMSRFQRAVLRELSLVV